LLATEESDFAAVADYPVADECLDKENHQTSCAFALPRASSNHAPTVQIGFIEIYVASSEKKFLAPT